MNTKTRWLRGAGCVGVLAATVVLGAGCGSSGGTGGKGGGGGAGGSVAQGSAAKGVSLSGANVTVGGKEFTEQKNLCWLTIDALKSAGASVSQKCGLNGSSTARQALTSGSIDMYWEYTGTGYVNFLKGKKHITDPTTLYHTVAKMDLAKNNIKWLKPAQFNDTYAIMVKTKTAKKLGVQTLSDYAKLVKKSPSKAKTCLASEFASRPDGFPGLEKAYNFKLAKSDIVTLSEGSIFNAVSKGNPCTFGEADASTDGRIVADHLTLLKDNKSFFPIYNPALNIRAKVAKKHPGIATVMNRVTDKLDNKAILEMNTNVDVKGMQPQAVAKKWLKKNDLIG
jgi:osmoprotectant transport system substrate-binding protein